MIFVDRQRVAKPASLDLLTDGKTETTRAIEFYSQGWDGKTSFDFKRYKGDDVKAALEVLFDGKCAYCESRFRHVSPEDVEHWRPKGAVQLADGKERKPGYYWLAATWSNLLPSCIDCNRRRRQVDVADPEHLQSGKESLFPVDDEALRWTDKDQPAAEKPLLLDPCADEPMEYLRPVESDGRSIVKVLPPPETLPNRRATQTIQVFGLNRSNLVDERSEQRTLLLGFMKEARGYLTQLEGLSPDAAFDVLRGWLREELVAKLAQIKAEGQPKKPYLMVKRPLIDGFMAEVGPALRRLGIV